MAFTPLLSRNTPSFGGKRTRFLWLELFTKFSKIVALFYRGSCDRQEHFGFFLTALSGVVIILPGAVRASRAEKFFFFADAETSKGIVFRADSIFLNKSSIFFIDSTLSIIIISYNSLTSLAFF
jgi:hypothetical protein